MTRPLHRRWLVAAVLLLAPAATPAAQASSGTFDGVWSVSIMADDMSCPTSTIPVLVSDGTISFSGFGTTATGRVTENGAIRLQIAMSEKEVSIHGRAHGREASGSWKMAPEGCGGKWSAQIQE